MSETGFQVIFAIICLLGAFTMITFAVLSIVLPSLGIFGGLGWMLKKKVDQAKLVLSAAQKWPTTTGEVIKSRVQVTGGDHTTVNHHIEYEYRVDGVGYTNTQVKAGDQYYQAYTTQETYDLVDKYPVGAKVLVYYNPALPSQAAIER